MSPALFDSSSHTLETVRMSKILFFVVVKCDKKIMVSLFPILTTPKPIFQDGQNQRKVACDFLQTLTSKYILSKTAKSGCEKHPVRGSRWGAHLLAIGLSLIWMVLSSWLFVLGRLKLFFFRWRREQHEPRPCGDDETEEAREPDLLIMEISMQFVWNVCSSTNSWFCTRWEGGRDGGEKRHVAHESLYYCADWLG